MTESHSGGTLAALAMNWAYDSSLRLQTATAKNGALTLQGASFGYDTAGRLQTVTDGPYSATYAYQLNSTLINSVTFANSGTTRLLTTRIYDKLNRLLQISSLPSASSAVSFGYQYNSANQRTRMLLADGSWWEYRYDALGQVVSGKRYWSDGTAVAGQQFEYGFDEIGNRKSTAAGGDANGADLRGATYTANRLNQYGSRSVPAYVDVLGIANPTAGVTVNGNTAYRKGEYLHHALNVFNSTAQYPTVTVVSQYAGGQTETGKVYVPPGTETFTHDADGNLISDGRWTYSWDAENRLVQMIRDTDSPAGARQKLVFEYDHQGRRIRKQFFTHSGGWVEQTDTMFLYDGWNLVAELNADASSARVRTYVWGTDLSGSMQGAGGVGGLLKLTYYGASTTNAFVAYDGNGNVTALIDAANGSVCARYEYGPFAEPIRSSDPLSTLNPIRFSTKYTDNESGFLYYGYRFYNPSTGRWLSRDPFADNALLGDCAAAYANGRATGHCEASALPYAFARNSSTSLADFLGLAIIDIIKPTTFLWSAPPCPKGQMTSYIQVGLGGCAAYRNPLVDTGKYGPASDRPTCPPLYPGADPAEGAVLFEDTPSSPIGTQNPLLLGWKLEVCRVCLTPCECKKGYRLVTVGPCRAYRVPGKDLREDLDTTTDPSVGRSGTPSAAFTSTLKQYYPDALKGHCFACDK